MPPQAPSSATRIDSATGGTALVAGAGVAGMRAALDLAEAGYQVVLTDASPVIGGLLAQLDHQFPNDHCGMCQLLPVIDRESASEFCLRKGLFHERIEILPQTLVTAIRGEPGAFEVDLRQQPRQIDPERCGCEGRCLEVCPVEVSDPFNGGLTRRKAIFRPTPFSPPNVYCIDPQACNGCGKCLEVCPSDAIDLDAPARKLALSADVIIFAAGTGLYDPAADPQMARYLGSPNVVSALQFERLLSPATSDRRLGLRRPADGKPLKRIAWLQCVGSRDPRRGRDFCSSICCMMALKQAVLARTKGGEDTETTIFYIDLRAYGKDFHRYRVRAEEEHGVRLVRCRVHELQPVADGDLRLRYLNPVSGKNEQALFDLVVLSTGQAPHRDQQQLTELLGRELSPTGPLPAAGWEKVRGPQEGVLLCGAMLGLSDISEAVVSGSAAASEASKLMAALGHRPAPLSNPLPQRAVATEKPRLAVMLCQGSGADPSSVSQALLSQLKEVLLGRPGVDAVFIVDDPCGEVGAQAAETLIKQSGANRLLIGAALPYGDQQHLPNLARRAGFNPGLTRLFDLYRPLLSLTSVAGVSPLVQQLISRLKMALEELKAAEFLPDRRLAVVQRALVVGGGLAGLRAALSLADRGIEVALVERSERLGGRVARELRYTLDGLDPGALIAPMIKRAEEHPKISLHCRSRIVESWGTLGNFQTLIRTADGREELLLHGAAILATGGGEAVPEEYSFGESDRILTQAELEGRLASGGVSPDALGAVVMIQCVGSREKDARQYCSRICCASALKNALRIKQANPGAQIVILKREVMTYGPWEQFYTQARRRGILFADYDPQHKPRVTIEGQRPLVQFIDHLLQRPVAVSADLLVLSSGIEPDRTNAELAQIFDLELTPDGFFLEAQSKWRPVDATRDGFFLAGMAHSPQPMTEVIAQAEACAQRVFGTLSRKELTAARAISRVRLSICARCQRCVEVCPYHARALDRSERRIVVDQASCRACGLCAASCPNGAAEVLGRGEKQVLAMIDAALADLEPLAETKEPGLG